MEHTLDSTGTLSDHYSMEQNGLSSSAEHRPRQRWKEDLDVSAPSGEVLMMESLSLFDLIDLSLNCRRLGRFRGRHLGFPGLYYHGRVLHPVGWQRPVVGLHGLKVGRRWWVV